jgi:hypothetical protein
MNDDSNAAVLIADHVILKSLSPRWERKVKKTVVEGEARCNTFSLTGWGRVKGCIFVYPANTQMPVML